MSRRVVLWIAFALVHLSVAWLGFILPSQPMGDVYLVYEPWSREALGGHGIVGIDSPWVYPQLALIPMMMAQGLGAIVGSYTVGWALLVTITNALVFAVLVGHGRARSRVLAAGFWLAAIALLGPIGMYRLDGFTVPLVILACLWLTRRPWLASTLLSVATWMKVWPAAVLAAALIALRRRGALLGGAVVVSVITFVGIAIAGGASNAFGFVTDQATRGLQLEAPVTAFYVWGTVMKLPGFSIYYDRDILTFQVTGPATAAVADIMTPLLVLAVAAVAVVGVLAVRRGARFASLFPALSLALIVAFIVFNKVGSPQYIGWLVPSVIIGLIVHRAAWTGPAILVLAISGLTQLIYPILYDLLLQADAGAAMFLTLRNALLIVLLVWTMVMLVRLARADAPALSPLHAQPSPEGSL